MKKAIYILVIILVLLTGTGSGSISAKEFLNSHASFSINYDGLKIPLQSFSVFVLPGEEIKIKIADEDRNQPYLIELGSKIFESQSSFTWNAYQQSGHYQAAIKKKNSNSRSDRIEINIFVLHPYQEKKGEYLSGFRIGNYPDIPADKKAYYSKPKGFLKIEKSLLDLNLTPHFKLKQFLTKQGSASEQFIVVKESLILKLEYLLEEFNKKGYSANTLGIVSAYRSPYFNKKLGNDTNFSRHVFGDAADIYLDSSGNSWMDDLNGDGKSDLKDADILFNIVKSLEQKEKFSNLQGGLCSYRGNGVRGPFIHIDTRGFHVSW